jgi:hypothetical protein
LAKISLEELGPNRFEEGKTYGIEIGIDLGTVDGRTMQLRWNVPDADGFYKDPSLWGEMKLK